MALPTPRVLPSHLHAFAPSKNPSVNTVRLLGTITSIRGDQATIESSDRSTTTLLLSRESHVSTSKIYEVIGKVVNLEGGHGVGMRVLSTTEWPPNKDGTPVDLKAYEAVVDATHRFKGIFYDDGTADGGEGDAGMDGGY